MKRTHLATDFSVGFVLFVATVVVIASLFLVGDGKNIFADHVEYVVRLPTAGGLKFGSKVSLGGVIAGSVTRIEFPKELDSSEILVTIAMERAYRERIRQDSFASSESQGLLGDTLIYVKPGTSGNQPLLPGSTIRFKSKGMIDSFAGEEITESTTDLIRTISSVLKDIARGQGTLGQLLKNPELYDNLNSFTRSMSALTVQVERISTELEGVLSEVRSQKGLLGQLIFSETYAQNLSTALSEASDLISGLRIAADAVSSGKGSVGKLIHEPDLADSAKKALDGLSSVAARASALISRAESSQSVLGRLATDGDLGRGFSTLVDRLEKSASALEKILAQVERGEGSVGMLVHDPSIAVSLRDLFRGVSESNVVQSVVRNAEQAGRDVYLRDESLARHEAEEILRLRGLRRVREDSKPAEGKAVPATGPEESRKN